MEITPDADNNGWSGFERSVTLEVLFVKSFRKGKGKQK